MKERCVNVKINSEEVPSALEWLGRVFAYRSAIWRIKGLYLTPTPTGRRELWWILGEQESLTAGMEGGEWE